MYLSFWIDVVCMCSTTLLFLGILIFLWRLQFGFGFFFCFVDNTRIFDIRNIFVSHFMWYINMMQKQSMFTIIKWKPHANVLIWAICTKPPATDNIIWRLQTIQTSLTIATQKKEDRNKPKEFHSILYLVICVVVIRLIRILFTHQMCVCVEYFSHFSCTKRKIYFHFHNWIHFLSFSFNRFWWSHSIFLFFFCCSELIERDKKNYRIYVLKGEPRKRKKNWKHQKEQG